MKESNIPIIGREPEHPVYEPVGDRIKVEEVRGSDRTEGGIIKPDRVKDQEKAMRLRVVSVGELVTRVVPGDFVLVAHQEPFPSQVPGRRDQFIVDMVNVVGISRQATRH